MMVGCMMLEGQWSGPGFAGPLRRERTFMRKVLMFLSQGFEDLEAVTIIDAIGWATTREHLIPLELRTCALHDEVVGKFGTRIKVDFNVREQTIPLEEFSAFVLPGGFHDSGFDEAYCEEVYRMASRIRAHDGVVATMCVGVLPIAEAGLLAGKKATTYPLSRFHDNVSRLKEGKAEYTARKVEMDSNIISCAGPASSLEVAFRLIEVLTGKGNADEVKRLMIY